MSHEYSAPGNRSQRHGVDLPSGVDSRRPLTAREISLLALPTTMKSLLLKLLVLLPSTLAWVAPRHAPTAPAWIARHRPSTTALRMSDQEEGSDSPCWQDLYADDCTMENIAAAGFIASKWIQSMPCGAGIEVSLVDRRFWCQKGIFVDIPLLSTGL